MRIIELDSQYAKLNRTLFFKGLYATLFSIVFVFALRSITRGHIGDRIVQIIVLFTQMDMIEAEYAYWHMIGRHMEVILCVAIILCMFLLFGVLLQSYKVYFEQVITGIEQITKDGIQPIVLSPELEAVELKLNAVKRDLMAREDEVRMAEQQKNELVVYLAHDIKTPLTSVIGYLTLLNDRQDLTAEKKRDYLRIALDKANRLELLVNEFFEITRYTLLSPPLEKKNIDLCYLFVQLIDELYPLCRTDGKIIRNQVDENAVVFGDAEKLARAFNNILKNAITYSTDKSEILISSQINDESVMIDITNEGVMPEEQISKVFEKFYRADVARRTDTGGSGLGLAIAKGIIELHGGNIAVRCDNSHTIFSVQLPLKPPNHNSS